MRELAIARWIFAGVAATYVLSAAMLLWVRSRGEVVPGWVIGAWLATGVAGIVLAFFLARERPVVWWALLVVLVPWMIYALVGDALEKHWFMAGLDAAALIAIARALQMAWPFMWHGF